MAVSAALKEHGLEEDWCLLLIDTSQIIRPLWWKGSIKGVAGSVCPVIAQTSFEKALEYLDVRMKKKLIPSAVL